MVGERENFERTWRDRFDRFAKNYDDDHQVAGWSAEGLRRRSRLFSRLLARISIRSDSRILDLGCGAGTYVRFLAEKRFWVIGLDYSLAAIYRALEKDIRRASSYINGEAYRLPFHNECLDLLVSIGVFQVLMNSEKAIDEIVRVVRPGGYVIIEFLNAYELIGVARLLLEFAKIRSTRVRTYSLFSIGRQLEARGMQVIEREGVYLGPRRLRSFGRNMDWIGDFFSPLQKVPGVALFLAHAFMLVARKGTEGR